jgi:hypothetical protein
MKYDFVEIGTSDFETVIQKCASNSVGLSIDPILYYLNRLPSKPYVHKVLTAVSDHDGVAKVFYISEEIIKKHDFPWWVRGCSSINAYHPTVMQLLLSKKIDPVDAFTSKTIPMYSVETLFGMYQVDDCECLKIDTEGHDCVILSNYLEGIKKGKYGPARKILFESNSLTPTEQVENTILKFQELGYAIVHSGENTILERQRKEFF